MLLLQDGSVTFFEWVSEVFSLLKALSVNALPLSDSFNWQAVSNMD